MDESPQLATHKNGEKSATYGADYLHYLAGRGKWRKMLRMPYLRAIRRQLRGATADVGCGIGSLLATLPAGSFGLEINADAVRFCKKRGLDVRWFHPDDDIAEVLLKECSSAIRSLSCMHVLEHLPDPDSFIKRLLDAASELQLERLVFAVPGVVGYGSDPTHRTFINTDFFERIISGYPDWYIAKMAYFPIPLPYADHVFKHNELHVVIERRRTS